MSEPSPTPETQPTEAVEPDVLPKSAENEVSASEEASAADAASVDPLAQALAEVNHWKDLAYRNAAELDNYRKRATRETQEARAYANADLLRALFPILDNFEMGLDAARAESEKSMIFMGMSMVHRQITDFLRDFNVTEVEALNQAFDPNLHDAVAQEVREDVAEGIVLKVTRRGFRLKERLLRAASVVVSAKPAAGKAEPSSEPGMASSA